MLKTRETRVEERKEEKRSEKRDRILRAAEAIFLDKGFHAASMNEIAEAANIFTPVENRELMTKILAQAETCILPFCGDKGSKATVS